MTKNTLGDLSNHLFEQLERLNDEELTEDQLKREIDRSTAMAAVADQIVKSGNLMLKAMNEFPSNAVPKMLGAGNDETA